MDNEAKGKDLFVKGIEEFKNKNYQKVIECIYNIGIGLFY